MIPHHLIEQIKLGNVVLFLGAGASRGSKNNLGEVIPDGKELSKLIASKFLGPDYSTNTDLSYVGDLAISTSSLFEVQKFIADILRPFEPEPHHLKVPEYIWKAIFTTNYDLIVEKSYQMAKQSSLQELVPVVKNTPKTQIFQNNKSLPYYKLHGCIDDINDADAPLILTIDHFINHKSKRDRLFTELQELSFDYPILFVGFGMADYDIRGILNNLTSNLNARTKSYMVGPGVTPLDIQMWEQKKITPLKMTFDEFLVELNSHVDSKNKVLSTMRIETKIPIQQRFVVSVDAVKPTESFISFIQNEIDYIHANMNAPNTDPKNFYKGYFENWDPIIKNLDINRKIKDGILTEIFLDEKSHSSDQQFFYLLKGNGGSGKSVLLKRIAYDAGVTLERFCIFIKDGEQLRADNVVSLYNYTKDRVYIFVDNIATCESEILYLISKCRREKVPITIIAAERLNVWNTECQGISGYLTQSYHVNYLHDSEINELIALLDKHNSLGTLKNKTHQEQINSFSQIAGRELLVALYEATNGSKPFEEIIYDEYKSINDAKAQSLYLTVSIFHRLGTEARAGFISRVHEISFHDFKQRLFEPLEFIVFDRQNYRINDFVYLTRNRLIAEIIFSKVLTTEQDRYDEYIRIIKNINIDYESDRIAFRAITNAKNLMKIFPDPKKIRSIFTTAEELGDRDAILLQQQAIFEMTSAGGSLKTAELYIKEAMNLQKKEPFLMHTYAEIFLKKAENARYRTDFYNNIREAIEVCKTIIKESKKSPSLVSPHAYHTILKANILNLQYILKDKDAPSIERAVKDIEKSFSEVKQIFPNEEFILEIESSFNEMINNTEDAKNLLEKAFDVNKGSPFIALRLANFHERDENLPRALEVVKEALNQNAGNHDLNFKYGMLLQKSDDPDYNLIEYHFRRSFTLGDARYQAQFWYARALFLNNKATDAKGFFEELSKANVAPDIKLSPTGIIKRNGKPLYSEGTIRSLEESFGFVQRDAIADQIFFYRFDIASNHDMMWHNFSRGQRVSFKIGFNYRGPVAISLTSL